MKSIPFRCIRRIPNDIGEGTILAFADEERCKVTKIKSIKFLSMNTFEVIGLCKPVE